MIASLRIPLAALALASCSVAEAPPHVAAPASAPAAAAPAPLVLDRTASLLTVVVGRAGPFGRLGHEHVVSTRQIDGSADPAAGSAALRFRLDQLAVDDPVQRAAAGLPGQLDADDIAGTRRNMLEKVLDAGRYPAVEIAVRRTGPAECVATITLHGQRRSYRLPVQIDRTGAVLRVQGALVVKQSDFGIVPYAILGGALQVADALSVRYDLHFR